MSEELRAAELRVLGVWQLQEWQAIFSDGETRSPFGEAATGQLTYDASGTMAGFLQAATAKGAVWDNFLSYSGPWRIVGHEIVHTVRFASRADWFGTELRRTMSWLEDGRLALTTEPEPTPKGRTFHYRLVWARG